VLRDRFQKRNDKQKEEEPEEDSTLNLTELLENMTSYSSFDLDTIDEVEEIKNKSQEMIESDYEEFEKELFEQRQSTAREEKNGENADVPMKMTGEEQETLKIVRVFFFLF